jgi:three-Cys-motif partner protein
MPTQSKFYNQGTERKLNAVVSYLDSFLTVVSKQNFKTVYVDAFAGSGTNPIEPVGSLFQDTQDADDIRLGSALRALKLDRRFSGYWFIDNSQSKLAELKKRIVDEGASLENVEFIAGDANEVLIKRCQILQGPEVRAVVFLDPFGNQVGWNLLQSLAETKHVDLLYLFPSMLGVYRQIGNDGARMTPEQIASLNHIFGPNDWKSAFISQHVDSDLFGDKEVQKKVADVNSITKFMIDCLDKVFAGGANPNWLPLGRGGAHWYSLLFTMANPSQKAKARGHALASHILTRNSNGRPL